MIKLLISEEEYSSLKGFELLPVECSGCGKKFFKRKQDVYRARIKGSENIYCSKKCISKTQTGCSNVKCKNCGKKFHKRPSEIKRTKNHFCSKSCAAKYNNKRYHKRKLSNICKTCNKLIPANNKYCIDCRPQRKSDLDKIQREKITKKEFSEAVINSRSIAQTLKRLDLSVYNGANRRYYKRQIEALKINTSHFMGQASTKGTTYKRWRIPPDKYFAKDTKRGTDSTRTRLIREGHKTKICEVCGITIWCNKPTPLELHHADGDRLNNTLDNLQILCPNCHAQTETYCGRNIKKKV